MEQKVQFNPQAFALPPQSIDFPRVEEQIMRYWREIDAFRAQLELTKDFPKFHFFDGPPFATGEPHYGHLLAGTIKDVVCRYWSQNGRYVPRRFGWDTHGVPVEYEIDKKLGITSPQEIDEMGIHNYNEHCRSIVMRYADLWKTTVERSGRWIDFENDYKTLKPEFMESVWWVFSQLWQKNLVYKGTKVMPYSTACGTPLSNFEAGQNYEDVQDPCCIVTFPVIEKNFKLVAWTTTPWTLPSNLALCVNEAFTYVEVKSLENGESYVVLQNRIEELFPENKKDKKKKYEIVETMTGKELVGLKYEPLFSYFADYAEKNNAFRVLADNYVTEDSGVGIVHIAPFFGEDDYRVAMEHGIITKDSEVICPVDESGKFTPEVTDFQGKYVKDADKLILENLKRRKRLFSQATIVHSYPFCYRSDTPLIYKAIPSWFVRVENMRDDLVRNNQKAQWVPDFVQQKRFHNWISNAKDWAISRNRYWGCPIPLWASEDGQQIVCVGSIAELEQLTGTRISDLHREYVDDLIIADPRGAEFPPMHRIKAVFDCWFESGSMPYAESHFPFENVQFRSDDNGLADFIAEGLDETRGWFYTLLILSTTLFDKPPAAHCIVNGIVLNEKGEKMSKRLKNYPPVEQIFDNFGADAMRMYLCESPAVRAEDLKFKEEGVKDVIKDVFLPWYNSFRFFAENYVRFTEAGSKFEIIDLQKTVSHVMDKWILAAFEHLTLTVRQEMESYKLYAVLPELVQFLNDLTNWYIRFNRGRAKGVDFITDADSECLACLNVLFYVLLNTCKLMAPFTPFLTEYMYHQLLPLLPKDERMKSIHFCQMPVIETGYFSFGDDRLLARMEALKSVIILGRMCRLDKCGVSSFKEPLKAVSIVHDSAEIVDYLRPLQFYILEELNVQAVEFHVGEKQYATIELCPDFNVIKEEYTQAERGKMVKAVEEFCRLEDEQLVKQLRQTGSVQFKGVLIEKSFCNVILKPIQETGAAADVNGFMTIFDLTEDENLEYLTCEREFFSKIQQARKNEKLQLTDRRNVVVECVAGAQKLERCAESCAGKVNGELLFRDGCIAQDDDFEVGECRWRVRLE